MGGSRGVCSGPGACSGGRRRHSRGYVARARGQHGRACELSVVSRNSCRAEGSSAGQKSRRRRLRPLHALTGLRWVTSPGTVFARPRVVGSERRVRCRSSRGAGEAAVDWSEGWADAQRRCRIRARIDVDGPGSTCIVGDVWGGQMPCLAYLGGSLLLRRALGLACLPGSVSVGDRINCPEPRGKPSTRLRTSAPSVTKAQSAPISHV